jgi:hypothetical protein
MTLGTPEWKVQHLELVLQPVGLIVDQQTRARETLERPNPRHIAWLQDAGHLGRKGHFTHVASPEDLQGLLEHSSPSVVLHPAGWLPLHP